MDAPNQNSSRIRWSKTVGLFPADAVGVALAAYLLNVRPRATVGFAKCGESYDDVQWSRFNGKNVMFFRPWAVFNGVPPRLISRMRDEGVGIMGIVEPDLPDTIDGYPLDIENPINYLLSWLAKSAIDTSSLAIAPGQDSIRRRACYIRKLNLIDRPSVVSHAAAAVAVIGDPFTKIGRSLGIGAALAEHGEETLFTHAWARFCDLADLDEQLDLLESMARRVSEGGELVDDATAHSLTRRKLGKLEATRNVVAGLQDLGGGVYLLPTPLPRCSAMETLRSEAGRQARLVASRRSGSSPSILAVRGPGDNGTEVVVLGMTSGADDPLAVANVLFAELLDRTQCYGVFPVTTLTPAGWIQAVPIVKRALASLTA